MIRSTGVVEVPIVVGVVVVGVASAVVEAEVSVGSADWSAHALNAATEAQQIKRRFIRRNVPQDQQVKQTQVLLHVLIPTRPSVPAQLPEPQPSVMHKGTTCRRPSNH